MLVDRSVIYFHASTMRRQRALSFEAPGNMLVKVMNMCPSINAETS